VKKRQPNSNQRATPIWVGGGRQFQLSTCCYLGPGGFSSSRRLGQTGTDAERERRLHGPAAPDWNERRTALKARKALRQAVLPGLFRLQIRSSGAIDVVLPGGRGAGFLWDSPHPDDVGSGLRVRRLRVGDGSARRRRRRLESAERFV
jgi:hypothetical protein